MANKKKVFSEKTTEINDNILSGVMKIIENHDSKIWVGTMTELRANLSKIVDSTYIPGSPSALRATLNRIVNRIRSRKVSVKFLRTTDITRTRLVKFTNKFNK